MLAVAGGSRSTDSASHGREKEVGFAYVDAPREAWTSGAYPPSDTR